MARNVMKQTIHKHPEDQQKSFVSTDDTDADDVVVVDLSDVVLSDGVLSDDNMLSFYQMALCLSDVT